MFLYICSYSHPNLLFAYVRRVDSDEESVVEFFVFWEKYVIRKIQETGCNQLDSFINITVDFGLC